MGVGSTGALVTFMAARRGASFKSTATIGRQQLFIGDRNFLAALTPKLTEEQITAVLGDEYSEPLFRALGAQRLDTIDASSYEGATIIQDLNEPIEEHLKKVYSAVLDFGSLEHIFNAPQALKNCIDMVDIDGWYIYVGPCNNMMGHGFYQFSPEFFFNFLFHNGFGEIDVFISLYEDPSFIFKVTDPRVFGGRIELINDEAVQICVLAKKAKHIEKMICPIQSDYVDKLWNNVDPTRSAHTKCQHVVDPVISRSMSEVKRAGLGLARMPKTTAPQLLNGFENNLLYEFINPYEA